MIGRRPYTPWLFLLPALVILGTFLWVPTVNTGILAFSNTRAIGGGEFTGLENFRLLLGDESFWNALVNSVLYVVVVVPLLVVLPLLIAVLVNAHLPGIGFFRVVFFTPVVASMVVVALIWDWVLQTNGLFNFVLRQLHLINEPIGWLTEPQLTLFSVMAVTVWKGLGYYMVLYLAGLQNINPELYDAAKVDGAGAVRRFLSITVPLLRPMMALVAALTAISALKVFTEVYVMTGGGPNRASQTLVPYIFERGIAPGLEIGYASAMSLVLFVAVLAFSLLSQWVRRRAEAAA
jgi:multiple sugar transport system permease protein